jgi:uncharacterized protein (TIGR03437 family)
MKYSLLGLGLLLASVTYAQNPSITAVVNGASFDKNAPLAAGSLMSIFGTALASQTAAADSIPLSDSLGNVQVNFVSGSGSVPAPMLYVQPANAGTGAGSQINAQVPWEAVPAGTSGTVNVVVVRDGVSSAPVPVNVGPYSPAIFVSAGRPVAVNQDGTLAWPAGAVPGVNSHPAKPDDVITIYATGIGPVDSPVADGNNSLDKLRHNVVTPVVMIGGVTAEVLFSGLSPQFVGVNQMNVKVPNAAPGDVALQIQVGGITTTDQLKMAVTTQ